MGEIWVRPVSLLQFSMKPRKPIRRISAKKLAAQDGKVFFSVKRSPIKRKPKASRIVKKSGRIELRGEEMKALREKVGYAANERCQNCGNYAPVYESEWPGSPAGEMDHIHGRGLGGSKRNDVPEEMQWLCGGIFGCHARRHIPLKVCPPRI
jgi:hypothetical protein